MSFFTWQLDHAKNEEAYKKMEQRGLNNPLRRKPTLWQENVEVYAMFITLEQHRTCGMEMNPIALSDILLLLDFYGIVQEWQRERYFDAICELDNVRMTRSRKKHGR